jgi:hypothetical protein
MLCFCILATATFAFSQSATTSLRGVVKDPTGALVPGATITLLDKANGKTLSATTNNSGYYIFPQIGPAKYLITVSAAGFGDQRKTAELLVNQPATVDFALAVQASTVTVDVSAEAQTLNLTDATIGNSVGNITIESLPMEGRDPVSLLSLQPGVLYIGQETGSADSRQGAVAGGRSDQGNVTLDGLDDNDQIAGSAFNGVLRSTMDSTEEFRVTTSNGTAEAGRSSGAQVNLVTKTGTNAFHGALYEYYRPTNTVANNFFNKNNQLSSSEPNIPQKYVLNTFGGSFGGPIKKDKLFFFFNYEGLRRAVDQIVLATVPTASFMAGELTYSDAANNTDILSAKQVAQLDAACATNTFNGAPVCPWGPGADPNVLSYYAKVPTNTGGAAGDGGLNSGSLFFPSPQPFTQNTSIFKLDYNLNATNRIFVRGNLQKDTSGGVENLPGQPPASFTDDNTKGIAFGYTWTANSNIVNDLRYGFIRQGYQISGLGKGDYVDFRFLTQPTAQTRNTKLHVPVNNLVDTFTWTKGTHTIALGGNWRGITDQHGTDANSFDSATTNPYWLNTNLPDPSTLSGFQPVNSQFTSAWEVAYSNLVGNVSQLSNVYNYKVASPTSGTALVDGSFINRNFRANEYEYYLQDSWRVRPNLTITYGVRHTILQTPYETSGQQVSPTLDTDAWYKQRETAAQQGQIYEPAMSFAPSGKANGKPGFWPKQKANFAPRLGVVYSPDAKTSIRASAGIYFDHYGEGLVNSFDQEGSFGLSASLSNSAGQMGFESAPRFTGANVLPAIPLPTALPTQAFPYTPPSGNFGIDWGLDNKLKTPYAESFNLSAQREMRGGFMLEAAYVGRLGRHLLEQLDLAEPVDYTDPKGGGDYFSAARKLSAMVDANGDGPATVAAIPYFENVFPYMQNFDGPGESATQAIYNNEWAPTRDLAGETTALADLDFYCWNSENSVPYNCPAQPRFWNSQFSSLYAWDTIGTSSYNALQFTMRHPSAHGFTVDLSYTYSKSLDLNSGTERNNELSANIDGGFADSAIQNTWNPKLNKGVSDFDTKSLITLDWVYVLPVGRGKAVLGSANRIADAIVGGWQWAGLGRWTSGLPFSFFEPGWSTDWQLEGYGVKTGTVNLRKHLINGLPQILDNPAAVGAGVANGSPIRLPYPGEAGQRNNFRGDGYFDIDSSLTKTWKLGEWAKLKFTGEVYNVTNSVRFDPSPANLNAGLGNGNALGAYSATLSTYRRMQFGLRLDF